MEIRNLITFAHVAELNSFTKAARELGYSQSTVSFQIKQLESELGCLLFERINRTVSLTEKGRELLAYAQKISIMTEEFNESMNATGEPQAYVRVVTPDSVCEDMMNANYIDFHSKYPNIFLKFTTADTGKMFELLDRNEADLMLTLDTHIYQSDYVIAKEEPVKMNFVTGKNSPYCREGKLRLADITNFPFILTEKDTGYRRSLDAALAKQSLEIVPVLEIGRTDIITSILERGTGVSFLPDFVTKKKIEEGKLVTLDVADAEFNIWKQLIYHRKKWISKGLSQLIDYIKANEFGR